MVDLQPIYIDNREHAVIAALCDLQIPHVTMTMTIGDMQIGAGWLFERKTINDLQSSILDGRFVEQRNRLRQLRDETQIRIGYIIEGQPKATMLNTGVVTALASLGLEFAVIISDSPRTTAIQLRKIAKCDAPVAPTPPPVGKVKAHVQTPTELLNITLENIPHIGAVTARAICTKYSSIYDFVTHACAIENTKTQSGRTIGSNVTSHDVRVIFGLPPD